MNRIEKQILKLAINKINSYLENYKNLPDEGIYFKPFYLNIEIPVAKIREKSVTRFQKILTNFSKTL